ncbi:MAG: type I-E CRISPR-associated protein Cas5/CasD [Desulfomonilaceae bacterium]|jgi:CRISPR system Cascade subunit CasD
MSAYTLFLRLEGPLQAWGDNSKFVIRRTMEAPTKSGVIGLLCAALGVSRSKASEDWLPKLSALTMGVRIDVPGVRWWDYHTVGAGMRMRIAEAEGKTKPGAMLTRREYLCDASFLVALQGDDESLIYELSEAIKKPKWTLYLGRKSCPPARPLLEPANQDKTFPNLESALTSVEWRRRFRGDLAPQTVDCLLDWKPIPGQPEAPTDALVWYDEPLTFEPPSHGPRFIVRQQLTIGPEGNIKVSPMPLQNSTPSPPRPRANYTDSKYRDARMTRLAADNGLCVFCKAPATTVQHITYRNAGGNESEEDLRSLCRLCHDAVTMIEYGLGMGLDRINPCEPRWRNEIVKKRDEIVKYRSLETRRRRLQPEEVE